MDGSAECLEDSSQTTPQRMTTTTSDDATNSTIFWEVIERYIEQVPKYVKNLLTLMGFDNIVAIQNIDEQDIGEIEQFVRGSLSVLVKMDSPEDYYHVFVNRPQLFKFVPGHKKLIFGIRDGVKSKGADNLSTIIKRRIKSNNELLAPMPVLSAPVSLASGSGLISPTYNITGIVPKSNGPPPSTSAVGHGLPPPKRKVSSSRDDNERRLLETINAYIERAQAILNDGCDYTIKKVTILFNQNEEAMSAGIFCSICKNVIKIGTQSNVSGRRWIISNYVRHFRRHFPIFAQIQLTGNLTGAFMPCEQEIMDDQKQVQEEFEIYCNSDESGSSIKREKRDVDYVLTSTIQSDEGSSSMTGNMGGQ